jgi:hypothetical protein
LVADISTRGIGLIYSQKRQGHTPPDIENECQQRGNEFWPCIMVNQSAKWLLLSLYKVLSVSVGQHVYEQLVAVWEMQ